VLQFQESARSVLCPQNEQSFSQEFHKRLLIKQREMKSWNNLTHTQTSPQPTAEGSPPIKTFAALNAFTEQRVGRNKEKPLPLSQRHTEEAPFYKLNSKYMHEAHIKFLSVISLSFALGAFKGVCVIFGWQKWISYRHIMSM